MNGALLREIRLAAGLSAREVAEQAGVTTGAIEQAEKRIIKRTTFERFVDAITELLRLRAETVRDLIARMHDAVGAAR